MYSILHRLHFKSKQNQFYSKRKKTYFVTLKTLRSRRALRPERPKDPALGLKLTQNTSQIDPNMTTQSNLLKAESK